MLKAILFDWDGTCHNSISKIIHCYEYAIKTLGYEPDWENKKKHLGEPIPVFAKSVCPNNPEGYFALYMKEYMSLPEAPLYEGTRETLLELKKDYTLCLVTGKPKENAINCLKSLLMEDIFDYKVCAEDCPKSKPCPEPLLMVVKHYNIDPREAVYIGDAVNDVRAAKAASIPVIGVIWGGLSKDEVEKESPDYIAESWKQVVEICNNLKNK